MAENEAEKQRHQTKMLLCDDHIVAKHLDRARNDQHSGIVVITRFPFVKFAYFISILVTNAMHRNG